MDPKKPSYLRILLEEDGHVHVDRGSVDGPDFWKPLYPNPLLEVEGLSTGILEDEVLHAIMRLINEFPRLMEPVAIFLQRY